MVEKQSLETPGSGLDKNIHATTIVAGIRKAADEAIRILDDVALDVDLDDRDTIMKIAKTSMRSKVIGLAGDHFANIAIDAVKQVIETKDGEKTAGSDDSRVCCVYKKQQE